MNRLFSVLFSGLFLLSLAACQKDTAEQAQVNNESFLVRECKAVIYEDKPALAVNLTRDLAKGQPFDQLIDVRDLGASQTANNKAEGVKVEGGWIHGFQSDVLVFPYVKTGNTYRITLADTLLDEAGGKLPAPHVCQVNSEEMSPSFFFASKGTVLPAGLNGGLPVVTVNVPEVDVEFLRVAPEKLPLFTQLVAGNDYAEEDDTGEYWSSGATYKGQTGGWELDRLRKLTQSVYHNRFVTNKDNNVRKTTFLPVESIAELKEVGVYLAVMRRPGVFDDTYQVTYFYVSDIGLHIRRQQKQTDVFTTSLTHADAQSNIKIEVLDAKGKLLSSATTDSDGHAILPELAAEARLLLARRGNEMSMVALQEPGLDLSEFDISGYLARDNKLFAWSGRDLYRPGERFTVSVLVRGADGKSMAATPVEVVVKNPSGDVVSAQIWQPNAQMPGYLQKQISLPVDAATGQWRLEFRVDPSAKLADNVLNFRVEEFMPERMKLTLKSEQAPLSSGQTFELSVQGDYLYGAPAAGNRLLGTATQSREKNPFAQKWPNFIFGDFADDESKQQQELPESMLDDTGSTTLDIPFAATANSPMAVRASMSLLESGGRPVVRSLERIWWPANNMIALRPMFDRDVAKEGSMAEFDVIRLNQKGEFAPLKSASYRLIREEREYYWRYDEGQGWHSGYSEREAQEQAGTVNLQNRNKIAVPVNWGRYRLEITDPDTKLISRYRFYAGWNAQDAESIGNRPDRVQLQLSGAPVKPGNDVTVNIIPPHDGEALVLVEADKVLWSKRVSVSSTGTKVTIPVDKSWARSDMYISTVVFRPGSQGDRVTPARAVGLTWLPLDNANRQLKVTLDAPLKVEPEKKVKAKVKVVGAEGKRALVTLSAVDVGILNITNFASPNPFDFYFGKQRYGVELNDIYGKLIERMDGSVGTIKWGGDAGKRDSQSMPKKVKLIDLFSGPVVLNAKGEAEIELNIPDFNGTLRLMAVAATDDAYGHAERELNVAAPIIAELATPRFISLGDNSTLALDVTNMLPSTQNIDVKLSADKLMTVNNPSASMSLASQARKIIRFNVTPNGVPYGLSKLTLDVRSQGAKPIVIRREFALQIQPSIARQQNIRRVRIEPNSSANLDPELLKGFYPASSTLSANLSNRPPLNINGAVKGLLDYPYGCLEQTTSAAYPYVFIDESAAQKYGLKPVTRAQRASFIEGAIGRIASMQGAEGGFRLWSANQGVYEAWLTAYVSNFLIDAREAGFNVPESLSKNAQDWMVKRLNSAGNYFGTLPSALKPNAQGEYSWNDYELIRHEHQAFAELSHMAYVLAREQKAPLASLRVLFDKYRQRTKSPLPLVQLGIALKLMGDNKRGDNAINEAMTQAYGINRNEWDWLGDYGSRLRDEALVYALMMRHNINHKQREAVLLRVSDSMSSKRYFSTQERMAVFLAAQAAGASTQTEWQAQVNVPSKGLLSFNSKTDQTLTFDPQQLQGVTFTNTSKNVLWLSLDASGFPLSKPTPNKKYIELERKWLNIDGTPWAGGNLPVGEMLMVKLSAKASQKLSDIMLVDHIPAGLEVENLNLSQGVSLEDIGISSEELNDTRIKHKEFRDDRFVAAVELDSNPVTVYYLLRVVTPGQYQVPASFAEDMYRPEIFAYGTAGERVQVVDPRAE